MKRRKRKPGYAARIKRQALARKKRLKAGLMDYGGRVVQPIKKRVKRNRKLKGKTRVTVLPAESRMTSEDREVWATRVQSLREAAGLETGYVRLSDGRIYHDVD